MLLCSLVWWSTGAARWTPFPFRPMHAWPVWCWPACVWSVYGHVVAPAVVLLVRGRGSRLMVGLCGVGSWALQRALAQSDLVRVGALLVSSLFGASCMGPAWFVLTLRRPPTVGERSNDGWFDRCKNFPNSVLHSLSRPGSVTCTTHHPVFRTALRPSWQLRLCCGKSGIVRKVTHKYAFRSDPTHSLLWYCGTVLILGIEGNPHLDLIVNAERFHKVELIMANTSFFSLIFCVAAPEFLGFSQGGE